MPTILAKPSNHVFASARRVNTSLTAALEKRLLLKLAEHVPSAVNSDHLTVLGLAAQIGAGLAYALCRHHREALLLVTVCIVLNWLGDSLDGTLARVRSQARPRYGFYVDHVVDILGSVALMCGMAASGYLHPQVASAMLIAFLVLSSESYLATYTLGTFQLSQGIFGPTEIRLLMIAGNLALLRSPYATLCGHRLLLFDLGGTVATGFMAVAALTTMVRHTAQLYQEEPIL